MFYKLPWQKSVRTTMTSILITREKIKKKNNKKTQLVFGRLDRWKRNTLHCIMNQFPNNLSL